MSDDSDTTASTVKEQKPWLFKPGQSGNPKGRVKGSRNKLGEQFLSALQEDFEANGVKAIVKVRTERPHEYLKVVASILPKELNVNHNALGEMSDDELVSLIDGVRAVLTASPAEAPRSRGNAAPRH